VFISSEDNRNSDDDNIPEEKQHAKICKEENDLREYGGISGAGIAQSV
jgi:hypothetical protein